VPLIVGSDRAKLSKRHGSTAVENYKENGTLSEALVNFLALIGWAPKDNREDFTLAELIEVFNPADIGKSAGMFNVEKLKYFNGIYIRGLKADEYYERLKPFCPPHWFEYRGEEYVKRAVLLYQDKLVQLNEIERNAWYFFTPPEPLLEGKEYDADELGYYNPKSVEKFITGNEQTAIVVGELYKLLDDVGEDDWNHARLESLVEEFCTAHDGLGKGKVMQPWRVMLTGDQVSPGFFDLIVVLGREETLARAKPWAEKIGG
jgi:glutamyl-tRNA synthetase